LNQTLQEKPGKVFLGKLAGVEYYYYFAFFHNIYDILQPEAVVLPNLFFAGPPPRTPLGEIMTLPQSP